MRSTILVLTSASLALASWQAVGQAGTDVRADARGAAMGSPFWADSSRFNLFTLGGNPIGLVPGSGKFLTLEATTAGTSLAGGGAKAANNHPFGFEMRTADSNKYGLRLGVDFESQTWKAAENRPEYQASRVNWGMDVGANLVGNRYLTMGFGLRGRFPSTQTQDTSGQSGTNGELERWQPALEALRVSMGSRLADLATLSVRVEAGAAADSLNHSPATGNNRIQHRFGRVLLPFVGFGAQFDRPDLPASGVLEYGFGTAYRIGVLKSTGNGANIDMPQLTTDSSRFLAAATGRIDKVPDHLFRPAMAVYLISGKTQAYAPVKGAQSTDFSRKGPAMVDTSWTLSRNGIALALGWEWSLGLKANLEWERQGQELSRDKGLGGVTDEHVDHRIAFGLQADHTLIPALREAVPAGTVYSLRLGLRKQSLAGTELEPGFLRGLTTGYEPNGNYPNIYAETYRNWTGVADQVGLNPQLGAGSDETAYTFGLGAAFLEGKLGVDAALVLDSWQAEATGSPELSGMGWNLGLRWSL
jgi:hypothetical protein